MEAVDWGYAISTLVIRFVGIFIVLGALQIVMQITGRIFARMDAREGIQPPHALKPPSDALSDAEAAAVGIALHLYKK
ncbi:MAG: hypothetical protein JRI36_01585 [Deltaproteobacteria bacterium]|nr:hypothetical protein [Deltaproteobacteria bacterium]